MSIFREVPCQSSGKLQHQDNPNTDTNMYAMFSCSSAGSTKWNTRRMRSTIYIYNEQATSGNGKWISAWAVGYLIKTIFDGYTVFSFYIYKAPLGQPTHVVVKVKPNTTYTYSRDQEGDLFIELTLPFHRQLQLANGNVDESSSLTLCLRRRTLQRGEVMEANIR